MQIPERPPAPAVMLENVPPERALKLLLPPIGPEVDGRYLHWDELRRRPPPGDLTHPEWWFKLWQARTVLRTSLSLKDRDGVPFHFARSDSVLRDLHTLDRELGNTHDSAIPPLANANVRDRYLVRSLMEEAITSSQLEGASTTRAAAKAMLRSGRPPATTDERMIVNNFRGMELVRARAQEDLSPAFLFELHRVLTEGTLDDTEIGRFRRADETISVQDSADGAVLHLPPAADQLPKRIAALCAFANSTADEAFIHPIIRSITLHFMLGYEHPFVDGNGRTARALFYWSMLRHRYWLAEFLTISRVIQKAKAKYARAFLFTETDSADLTYFVLHQLGVVSQAVTDLREYLDRKALELRESEKLLRAGLDLNLRQRALISHALKHPDTRYDIGWYRRENNVVYDTARTDLLALAEAGLLVKSRVGKAFVFDVPPDLAKRLRGAKPR